LGEQVTEGKCLECHERLSARILAEQGYHALLRERKCIDCHSDHRGIDYAMVRWDTTSFDHDSTGYALADKHAVVNCGQCHQTESYLGLEQTCLSCHADQHREQLASECLSCHDLKGWKPVVFDHATARYKLEGKHVAVACESCHRLEAAVDGGKSFRRYRPLSFSRCSDCHADYHRGQFAEDCSGCHGETGWKPVVFDHERARYRLMGKHASVVCGQCHPPESQEDGTVLQRYRPLSFSRCVDCHRDPHQPSLGRGCEDCHAVAGWRLAGNSFDHERSRFPLRGAHARVRCEQCHVEGHYRDLAFSRCNDCHADYHRGQFDEDCSGCHGEAAWKPVVFDHERARYKLVGKHASVDCGQCHRPEDQEDGAVLSRYRPLSFSRCSDCHADYHRGQFVEDCSGCHGEAGWKPVVFDHDRATFRLDGAHVRVGCEQCHLREEAAEGESLRRYKPVARECAACHQ